MVVNNFILSNDVDTNDAFVFYNGVCMTPTTDYAISGKIITFTFTPVANSQVMVRYGVRYDATNAKNLAELLNTDSTIVFDDEF